MITSIELMTAVYKIVKNSAVKTVINGDIYYSGYRPLNSEKNDIIIGTLTVDNSTVQSSIVLINIFAKDIYQNKNYLPDYSTLKAATKLLEPLFKDVYIPELKTNLDIKYQRDYKVEDSQEWMSVIRIKTRTINN